MYVSQSHSFVYLALYPAKSSTLDNFFYFYVQKVHPEEILASIEFKKLSHGYQDPIFILESFQ